ncbi:MAG: ABC transporter permease [Candidatus Thiodiazotropha endolucinida]
MKKIALPAVAFVAFLIVWELLIVIFKVDSLILPSPEAVLDAFFKNWEILGKHAFITLSESLAGFMIGGVVAFSLAILFFASKNLETAIYPYAIVLKSIPLIALAPIISIWFGTGITSKVVLAAIISFFPILVTTLQGLKSYDKNEMDIMLSFSASRSDILRKMVLPNAMPSIFSGLKVSSTFSVIGAIVAEFTGADKGIGYYIKSASYYLNSPEMFAGVFVAGVAGLLFFGLVVLVEKKVVFWRVSTHSV